MEHRTQHRMSAEARQDAAEGTCGVICTLRLIPVFPWLSSRSHLSSPQRLQKSSSPVCHSGSEYPGDLQL